MKSLVAIVLLLAVLSLGSFWGIGDAVSREKENVTLRETVLYGDRSYAEGVSVLAEAHYDRHLFWSTSYRVGENAAAATDYRFYPVEHYESGEPNYQGVILDTDLKYGLDTRLSDEEAVGLQKAYRELYLATKPGEERSMEIYLADYYDYYPIRVSMDLFGVRWSGNDYEAMSSDRYEKERRVWEAFREFFKIPVPENLPPFEITVSRGVNGGFGCGSSGHGYDYYFNVKEAHTEDRVFFSISNRIEQKDGIQYIDTSLIPGGYGIYAFSYENVRATAEQETVSAFPDGYDTGIRAETLSMVFPLDREAEVLYLALSHGDSRLLIFTREGDITYLTVVDTATMEELQRIRVTDQQYYTFYEYSNCIVLCGWESISVIELQEGGACRLAFTVPRMEEVNDSDYQRGVAARMAFDGERLVIVDSDGDHDKVYNSFEGCGFTLAVYNATGLVYYGEYESSLSVMPDPNDYGFNCMPVRYQVSFTD